MPCANAHDDLAEVRRLVLNFLRPKVWLFGSRARGDAAPVSDIALALLSEANDLSVVWLAGLRELLEESHIPWHVDVADLRKADMELKHAVMREGILWSD
ncbi:nucleotidyltransferase domain-containing protein [Candidatus Parcubacteria bacterium]|nr:MAG: nucleotidyltransferase domain-containing protein [Candidatus Parcubacteria bacterium]